MKFGLSYAEKNRRHEALVISRYKRRFRVFAWLPTLMVDGTYAWLEYIWKDYKITPDPNGGRLREAYGKPFEFYYSEK